MEKLEDRTLAASFSLSTDAPLFDTAASIDFVFRFEDGEASILADIQYATFEDGEPVFNRLVQISHQIEGIDLDDPVAVEITAGGQDDLDATYAVYNDEQINADVSFIGDVAQGTVAAVDEVMQEIDVDNVVLVAPPVELQQSMFEMCYVS